MPIYEFYCPKCHAVYSFFSRKVDTETVPSCPKVKRHKLQKQVSRFAISKGGGSDDGPPEKEMDFDEDKMEQAMMQMAGEMENVSEDDPKAMAHMMRRMMDTTGMEMGEGMQEAIRRMEAGEDPDKVEEDLSDVLDLEDPFSADDGKNSAAARLQSMAKRFTEAPYEDPEMYDM